MLNTAPLKKKKKLGNVWLQLLLFVLTVPEVDEANYWWCYCYDNKNGREGEESIVAKLHIKKTYKNDIAVSSFCYFLLLIIWSSHSFWLSVFVGFVVVVFFLLWIFCLKYYLQKSHSTFNLQFSISFNKLRNNTFYF